MLEEPCETGTGSGVKKDKGKNKEQARAIANVGMFHHHHVSEKKDKDYTASKVAAGTTVAYELLDFPAFSTYVISAPYFSKSFRDSAPYLKEMGKVWNLDAVLGVIIGGCQVVEGLDGLDRLKGDARDKKFKLLAKGATNLAASSVTIALTIYNFALCGGPAFTASAGLAFVHSLDETARYCRHVLDSEYWYNDTKAELEILDTQIYDLLSKRSGFNTNFLEVEEEDWKSKLKKYSQILAGFWSEKSETSTSLQKLVEKAQKLASQLLRYRSYNQNRVGQSPALPPEILKECCENLIRAVVDNLASGLAFASMVVLCVEGVNGLVVGLALTASALFVLKNVEKAIDYMMSSEAEEGKVKPIPTPTYGKMESDDSEDEGEGEGFVGCCLT